MEKPQGELRINDGIAGIAGIGALKVDGAEDGFKERG